MIKLKELLFGKPDCDCGCGNCEGTTLNEQAKITENLQYHLDNKIPLGESIFRISSNAHVKLFKEVRQLWENSQITLSEADEYFMHTDAGRQAKALVDAGVPLQISSRAAGAVESNGQVKIKQLFTYDLVADPGFENAQLNRVNESYGLSNDSNISIFEINEEGMVTETDVTLAKASNAVLIAFNVKPSKEAKKLAENEKIKISSYNIIYEVLDYIKQKMSGLLTPDIQEKVTGNAQILEIFKVSGAGKVAGCKITEGEITSTSDVRLIRDGAIIYTGKVGTLFREKNQVKQVSNGQECGITIKDYMDFQKDDTIEAFSVTSTERTI